MQVSEHFLQNFFAVFIELANARPKVTCIIAEGHDVTNPLPGFFSLLIENGDHTAELGHCVSHSKDNLPIHFDGLKGSPGVAGYQY